MSPLKHSKSIAARMGRWSAHHRRTAVLGWLLFVIASFATGGMTGTKQIDEKDATVGESRTGDRIIRDAGFTVNAKGESVKEVSEMVLVQSRTLTTDDAAYRAAIQDIEKTLGSHPEVTQLKSPLGADSAGLVSKDHHSVLIQYVPKGTHDEAVLYIDEAPRRRQLVPAELAGLAAQRQPRRGRRAGAGHLEPPPRQLTPCPVSTQSRPGTRSAVSSAADVLIP